VAFWRWLSWWHNEPAVRLDDVDGMPCTAPRSVDFRNEKLEKRIEGRWIKVSPATDFENLLGALRKPWLGHAA
jgi:hypothetical protein